MYSKVIQLYILIYILFHILFPYSLSQDTECSLVLYCRTVFIHSVCISLHLRERDRESLRHFSKNMSKYLIHFPKIEDTIYFPVFFCHLTMYLGDIFKLKHSLFLFFCFLRNTNFAQKKILILLHLSIRLDIFAIPCILSIRVKGQHTLSHDQNRWLHLVSCL